MTNCDKDKERKWVLVENIPDSDIFFFHIGFRTLVQEKSYEFMSTLNRLMAVYNGFHMDFYMEEQGAHVWSDDILNQFINRPGFAKDVNENIVKWSGILKEFGQRLKDIDVSTLSNQELWDLYDDHYQIHSKLYTYAWYPGQVDMLFNDFTNKLKTYLSEVCGSESEVEQAFVLLTTPTEKSIIAKEREELLYLFVKHQEEIKYQIETNDGDYSEIFNNEVQAHREKWGHLGYVFAGNTEIFSVEHYVDELKSLAKSEMMVKEILHNEKAQLEEVKQKQEEFYKTHDIPEQYQVLFQAATDFSLSKLIRRDAQLYTLYQCHHVLLEEIAKRLSVSRQYVQFMMAKEVHLALIDGELDREILNERLKSCVYFVTQEEEVVYTGEKAQELKTEISYEVDLSVTTLKGQVAQPGYARGKVKVIIRAQDMEKMNKGDILVSIATDPDIVTAMKRAAAIITEQGGITSHAAIVSRELGIPCVIGTKIATKILKDGDEVEVDANHGVVTKLHN